MAYDVVKPLKKMLPHLLKAKEDNLNEADTVQRLVKVFEDVLGYDGMTEITRESQIKGGYVDLAIKVDGSVKFLVEAKSAGTTLRDRHIEQAERYAAEGNIPWVVLSNGVNWSLYHLTFDEGIEYERAFTIDLATDTLDQAAGLLGLLHRQGWRGRALDAYWEHRAALSPQSIGRALFTEETLAFIRRVIRRDAGLLIDPEDLAAALHGMFSTEAREAIGPLKVRRKRKAKTPRRKPSGEAEGPEDGEVLGDALDEDTPDESEASDATSLP